MKPNQISYYQDHGETALKFITVDPSQYESLSKELGSTIFAFELQNSEEHPFMDGKLFPNIELIITEVYVNENSGNRRTKRWKRYEIQLIIN